jgi:hypothetical protein
MGRPMTYKTGAIVGSYPLPMLVLSGDPHGLTIVPAEPPVKPSAFKMQVVSKDLKYVGLDELFSLSNASRETLPKVTIYPFSQGGSPQLSDLYQPTADSVSFAHFNRVGNALIARCPWRTVLIDPITELQNIVFAHLAATQPGQLATPMKWAPSIGMKICNTLSTFHRLPAHLVAIFHTSKPDKDETTSRIEIEPVLFSEKARSTIGGLFAQVFGAEIQGGKPVVLTQPQGYYTSIGCKWPHGLPAVCGADFDSIYGNSVKTGEVER